MKKPPRPVKFARYRPFDCSDFFDLNENKHFNDFEGYDDFEGCTIVENL